VQRGIKPFIIGPLKKVWQRFTVSEAQIADHLEAIRTQLPTTEVILIGKPQAGKSSIVRGMTGQPADMIGQGFKPHTRSTQQYPYPAADLPLLIFTDTVGLGDVERQSQEIVADLTQMLKADGTRSRLFVLTVKITDFANDSLRQVISELRQGVSPDSLHSGPDLPARTLWCSNG
jgi:predicted GTPase